ncbi:MAG: DUF2339 domain-containing protein [Candidatus Woesearchaeota archaeon]
MALKDRLDEHEKEIKDLQKRVALLEGKEDTSEETPTTTKKTIEKRQEDTWNFPQISLFKVFGGIGTVLILLAAVYFYQYAVDQGYIGITGRIVLGILIGLGFLSGGLYMKNQLFSQLLEGVGLGLIYFTIFATYHFEHYRQALGMTLTLNTLLLLVVMVSGMIIGMRQDTRFVVYISLLMGYVAAFLAGIEGETLQILFFVLIINLVVLLIAKLKEWYIGIPAQVLSYIAFLTWYIHGTYSPEGIISQTSYPVLITFFFLFVFFGIFTLLSFIQASANKEEECIAISIINGIAIVSFGLGLIIQYYPDFNGLYMMACAAILLCIGALSKRFDFRHIFDIHFLMSIITIAIAIPVQFDKSIVTVLWVAMALGLAYGGILIKHERLFYTGYIGYIIPYLRGFYDLQIDGFERFLSLSTVIIGLIILTRMRDEKVLGKVYSIAGLFLFVIWMMVEILYLNIESDLQSLLISVVWALTAIGTITYGVSLHEKSYNWAGILLFGIVVLKVLLIDISMLSNIVRVMVLFLVGILALAGAFVFVRNKEKIKGFL